MNEWKMLEFLRGIQEKAYLQMAKIPKVKYLRVVTSLPFWCRSAIFRKYLESEVPHVVPFICIGCVPLLPPPSHSCLCGLPHLSYLFCDLFSVLSEFGAMKGLLPRHSGPTY